jgi:hypothetical protein
MFMLLRDISLSSKISLRHTSVSGFSFQYFYILGRDDLHVPFIVRQIYKIKILAVCWRMPNNLSLSGSLRSKRLVRAGKEKTPAQMAVTNLFSPIKDD